MRMITTVLCLLWANLALAQSSITITVPATAVWVNGEHVLVRKHTMTCDRYVYQRERHCVLPRYHSRRPSYYNSHPHHNRHNYYRRPAVPRYYGGWTYTNRRWHHNSHHDRHR